MSSIKFELFSTRVKSNHNLDLIDLKGISLTQDKEIHNKCEYVLKDVSLNNLLKLTEPEQISLKQSYFNLLAIKIKEKAVNMNFIPQDIRSSLSNLNSK